MKSKAVTITALICAAALSACGSRTGVNVTPPDGKLDGCTLRFSWWGGDDRHEATLNALELWKKLHPEIVIVPEYGGWDGWTEKVTAQMNGGTAPDVMQINYDWLISMSPDGTGFYDLESIPSYPDVSGYDSDVLSFGRAGGRLNAIPVSISGRGLFYNSQVYKRLGADYPSAWEELLELGDLFSGSGAYPLDLDIQSGGTAWYLAVVYVQQQTGRQFITMDGHLGFTTEDIKAVLDFYKELEERHVIRTIKTRTDEDGSAALYQSPEFISGNVAGVLEWGSSVGKYEMVLPEGALQAGPLLSDGEHTGGWMVKPSLMYAVSAGTEHPDEAAAFIDFLLNNGECAELLGTTRGIPSSAYARERLESTGKLSGLAVDCAKLLDSVETVTISPYMELARMKEYYNEAIESVSYGTSDTASAAESLYSSLTEYLEKIRR